jgi:hypothetical protein
MHRIEISEEVWQAIAAHGKFGETEDDVLRRILKLPATTEQPRASSKANGGSANARRPSVLPRRSFATQRMSSYTNNGQLHVSFAGGPERSWSLPGKNDKAALLAMREKAVAFVRENKATLGQVNALKKTLTDAGYYLTR